MNVLHRPPGIAVRHGIRIVGQPHVAQCLINEDGQAPGAGNLVRSGGLRDIVGRHPTDSRKHFEHGGLKRQNSVGGGGLILLDPGQLAIVVAAAILHIVHAESLLFLAAPFLAALDSLDAEHQNRGQIENVQLGMEVVGMLHDVEPARLPQRKGICGRIYRRLILDPVVQELTGIERGHGENHHHEHHDPGHDHDLGLVVLAQPIHPCQGHGQEPQELRTRMFPLFHRHTHLIGPQGRISPTRGSNPTSHFAGISRLAGGPASPDRVP